MLNLKSITSIHYNYKKTDGDIKPSSASQLAYTIFKSFTENFKKTTPRTLENLESIALQQNPVRKLPQLRPLKGSCQIVKTIFLVFLRCLSLLIPISFLTPLRLFNFQKNTFQFKESLPETPAEPQCVLNEKPDHPIVTLPPSIPEIKTTTHFDPITLLNPNSSLKDLASILQEKKIEHTYDGDNQLSINLNKRHTLSLKENINNNQTAQENIKNGIEKFNPSLPAIITLSREQTDKDVILTVSGEFKANTQNPLPFSKGTISISVSEIIFKNPIKDPPGCKSIQAVTSFKAIDLKPETWISYLPFVTIKSEDALS